MDLMGIKYAGDVINRIDKSDFFQHAADRHMDA